MNFRDTLQYMYNQLPMYQRVGQQAFKKDLTNIKALCRHIGNPQDKFRSIHVAGTNGKGSSAHMLASVLQSAGLKTGLYTSPHLKTFTERIRINESQVSEVFVCEFIEQYKSLIERLEPSFFEITVAMAFLYFSEQHVDVAVVEVGLGGRLDSTNIITPDVSLITSIGLDHTDMLGNTLPEIAGEKAGIIKAGVPVVISEFQNETAPVFESVARDNGAPIFFADRQFAVSVSIGMPDLLQYKFDLDDKKVTGESDLGGVYQAKNLPGVIQVFDVLRSKGYNLTPEHLQHGLAHVKTQTGLLGRWQKIAENPWIYCDTAHNHGGVELLVSQINMLSYHELHLVWGAVEGKDMKSILDTLPDKAFYYFCEAKIPRAMKAEKLAAIAGLSGKKSRVIPDVNKAIEAAVQQAAANDLIVVAGSNFIIAEIENLTG